MHPDFYSKYVINYSGMLAFGWSMFNFKDTFRPISYKKKLQINESFSPIIYFLFSTLYFFYMHIIKKLFFKSKSEKLLLIKFKESPPKDIVEFVNFIIKNK